jgi:hypothetical protein
MNRRIAFAAALLLSTASLHAQDTAPAAAAAPTAGMQGDDAVRDDAAIDRNCLRETGTHIRRRAKADGKADCPSPRAGRVYTQQDLRSTGQVDIADALRMLDTSIR